MTTQRPAAGREWLLDLKPRGPDMTSAAASSPATIAETISHVGESPVCWAIEVGREMATTITREIPAFGGGEGPFQILRKGTESSTLRAMVLLAFPDVQLSPITEEALEGDREFVRRGIALDKVLRGIRLGHAGMAQAFLAACEALVDPDRVADEMKAVSEDLFGYIDAFSGSMVTEFLAERDRWITSAAAARAETVNQILAGDEIEVRAASSVLGYDLDRCHLALIAWANSPGEVSALERIAEAQLRARGATATLAVPIGSSALWAWGTIANDADPATLPAPPVHADIRIALGLPGRGVDGFRRSHEQATRAERLARLAGDRAAPVTSYAEISAIALLAEDIDSARNFVERELGPLADSTSQVTAALRETLLQYLEQERSISTVATHLHLARGTVAYRVKKAEAMLGHEVGQRRFELHAALLLAQALGDAVLPEPR
ncbi:PucR family transcriptional regulator [Prauserella endophytica]|uniref:PucR family transcriptional regulator n=1 Tax=Prauserella endophytica TaxID=1592324 RepID=A0ABY2S556_9PSEU|nr:helix-turn-helix domain-containing protein [Prauserella endophytica]TKG70984.1 PucR family transcriptional regulator [Prauserella endophytica]